MKRKIIIITITLLLLALVMPYVYVEIMTVLNYEETVDLYEKTGWISSDNYHKVFSFSQDNAKILYSEPYRVSICEFSKDENGDWQYKNIEPVLFRNNLESMPFGFTVPEKNIYPLYPTKHLIEPEESETNFDLYEEKIKAFAEEKGFLFNVVSDENNSSRTILLSDETSNFEIRLFNDYDGFRGYEQAEITYTCKKESDFDAGLLVSIQEQILYKIADEKNIAEILDSGTVFDEAKLVREAYPEALEIKTKDILGNGEYLLSYIDTKYDKIIFISGTTKRTK